MNESRYPFALDSGKLQVSDLNDYLMSDTVELPTEESMVQ